MNAENTTRAGHGTLMLFNGPGQAFEQKDFDIGSLQPNEILVKTLYTTLCGSDVHTFCP